MSKKVEEKINYKGFDKVFYYTIIFFIASFIGYIYEVIFYLVDDKVLVNRGFLYGPYLPVYGFGALLMVVTLKRFVKNPVLVFLLAMFVTGVTEYVAGALIYNIYHERWWDYTGLFLNIDGYVCLRSVFSFGIGALLLFYLLEPFISQKVMRVSHDKRKIVLIILVLTIIIDLIFTLIFRHPL